MIIVNTPHNPVGKVFTKSELEAIAAIAEEFNLLVMADEVVRPKFFPLPKTLYIHLYQYDCLVFDGMEHVRIANLPGMWDRTITVGSAGSKHTSSPRNCNSKLTFYRGICRNRVAYWLAYRPSLLHPAYAGREYPHCLLHKFAITRSGCSWSRTS